MAQILLVDDEKLARTLYGDFLTGAGHTVVSAGSSSEAKEALASKKFDLVVTDLILPQRDGMELLQYVKTSWPDVEVVVITALDKVEPAVRAIKSGASDYLLKPVTPETLAHAVNRALAQHSILRENETLRQHVILLEAGQRIVTTLDRERLVEATGAAFQSICGAAAAVVFMRESGSLEVAGTHGISAVDEESLRQSLLSSVPDQLGSCPRAGTPIPVPSGVHFESGYLLPVYEGDVLLGAVLLLFAQAVNPNFGDTASYLARHVGMALRNLGKFAEVEDLVYLDDLTHLFNSRYLELILEKEFRTNPPDKAFALLFMDLDYFKSVNDTHGHVIGSKLLVEVSKILKNCVRDNDVVCRWGGDEYVVLLRSTDSGGALKVAERIRRSIEAHRFLAREGFSLSISTCIGVAAYPEHAGDKSSLLDFADRAMYRGKKGSRNIIYIADKNLEATPEARHQTTAPSDDKN
jgi:diguanylate cyclase (GGDEF)-like protein